MPGIGVGTSNDVSPDMNDFTARHHQCHSMSPSEQRNQRMASAARSSAVHTKETTPSGHSAAPSREGDVESDTPQAAALYVRQSVVNV